MSVCVCVCRDGYMWELRERRGFGGRVEDVCVEVERVCECVWRD